MYPEVEQYYSDFFKKENVTDSDNEETIQYTKKFYQIHLLNTSEYNFLMYKLNENTSERISSMNLTTRAYNALNRGAVYNYSQLRDLLINADGCENLFSIRNLGPKSLKEIIEVSFDLGIASCEEISNAGWTHGRKTMIDEILSLNVPTY